MIKFEKINGKIYLPLKVNSKKVMHFGLDYDCDLYRNRTIYNNRIYTTGIFDCMKYWFLFNRDYLRIRKARKKYKKKHDEDTIKYLSVSLSKTNDF